MRIGPIWRGRSPAILQSSDHLITFAGFNPQFALRAGSRGLLISKFFVCQFDAPSR